MTEIDQTLKQFIEAVNSDKQTDFNYSPSNVMKIASKILEIYTEILQEDIAKSMLEDRPTYPETIIGISVALAQLCLIVGLDRNNLHKSTEPLIEKLIENKIIAEE